MASTVQVPALGESVKQAVLLKWYKNDGDTVKIDEPLCELETDKANVDVPSPLSGVLRRLKSPGDTVAVGEALGEIAGDGAAASAPAAATPPPAAVASPASDASAPAAKEAARSQVLSPAVRRLVEEHQLDPSAIKATGPSGRLLKEDVLAYIEAQAKRKSVSPPAPLPLPPSAAAAKPTESRNAPSWGQVTPPDPPSVVTTPPPPSIRAEGAMDFDAQGVYREPMSKLRKRIAERLVSAQHTAAILTTFNEVDLSEMMALRNRYRERFQEVHGVGLGLMSFFVRAAVLALREYPRVNAFVDGDDFVFHNHVHMGIAVSTERGLAVPVLRNAQSMSFARIEAEIKRLALATREGKLSLEELSGGTFTITNGGVFGSLLSTPILNPPQSGILGMHAVQKRPVVVDDKIEIRPMMYVALSYDHRIIDGRESVSFLVRVKQYLEDPARLMLEI